MHQRTPCWGAAHLTETEVSQGLPHGRTCCLSPACPGPGDLRCGGWTPSRPPPSPTPCSQKPGHVEGRPLLLPGPGSASFKYNNIRSDNSADPPPHGWQQWFGKAVSRREEKWGALWKPRVPLREDALAEMSVRCGGARLRSRRAVFEWLVCWAWVTRTHGEVLRGFCLQASHEAAVSAGDCFGGLEARWGTRAGGHEGRRLTPRWGFGARPGGSTPSSPRVARPPSGFCSASSHLQGETQSRRRGRCPPLRLAPAREPRRSRRRFHRGSGPTSARQSWRGVLGRRRGVEAD